MSTILKDTMPKNKEDIENLEQVFSAQNGETIDHSTAHDAVFGAIDGDGPNYRNVGWLGTTILMMKTQIGLGVLSIPKAFDALGIVPGVLVLCLIAAITTWSDYMIGTFKLKHPSVYGIDDAMGLVCGRIGREIFAVSFCLYWIFVSGSGMLGISIALNAVSLHGACTAVFVAVAAIAGFMLASIQTLNRITWLAWVGLAGILSSIITVTIAVGLQDRPTAAPMSDLPFVSNYKVIGDPTFSEAITAVSSIIFAYSGTPAFFSIVSEMRDPRHFTRSVMLCQTVVTCTYLAIGCVVYYFCGSYVASPALGSAGPILKRVCYGLALPGLIVTTLIVTHIPGKYLFVRIFRGSRHLTSNTKLHWIGWLSCILSVTLVAYIIASAIPVFNSLVSLVGALLGTMMCFQPMGFMWLYDNWNVGKHERSLRWRFMVGFSIFVIVAGTFLMIGGTYGSIVSIMDSYRAVGGSAAWSCADNSNST